MKPDVITDNSIFKYAFAGALLFIMTMGFTVAHLSNIVMFELSSTIVACVLGIASFSLLYKAIKHDKRRLEQAQGLKGGVM